MILDCDTAGLDIFRIRRAIVFYGTLRNGLKVTVFLGNLTHASEEDRFVVKANTVILGSHFDITRPTITSFQCRFADLNGWAKREPIHSSTNKFGHGSAKTRAIAIPPVSVPGASVSLELVLPHLHGRSYQAVVGANEIINVQLQEPSNLARLVIDYLAPLEQAYSLATGQRVVVDLLTMQTEIDFVTDINGGPLPYRGELHVLGLDRNLMLEPDSLFGTPNNREAHKFYVHPPPLPRDALIPQRLSTWFERRDAYQNLAEVILAPGVENLPPHARLVLLAGSLEEFHKLRFPEFKVKKERERAELARILKLLPLRSDRGFIKGLTAGFFCPSFTARLTDLMEMLPPEDRERLIFDFRTVEAFIKAVKDERNVVAHTGGKTKNRAATEALCTLLELLSRCVLFADLGLKGKELSLAMCRDPRFRVINPY